MSSSHPPGGSALELLLEEDPLGGWEEDIPKTQEDLHPRKEGLPWTFDIKRG